MENITYTLYVELGGPMQIRKAFRKESSNRGKTIFIDSPANKGPIILVKKLIVKDFSEYSYN